MRVGAAAISAAFSLLLVACDDGAPCQDTRCVVDAGPDAQAVDAGDGSKPCNGPPGLYVPGSCSELAPGLRAYAPQYILWSDGASKNRFVFLPPASTIDTSEPDRWVYPQGTRVYKHFDLAGRHIETRLIEKTGSGEGGSAWTFRTFRWNAAQDSVAEVVDGATNVLGTDHDIPSAAACPRCHAPSPTSGVRDVLLSFSAIQLNHAGTGVSLATLASDGRLSHPIDVDAAVIPGDATAKAALGYLHANCGQCHNGAEPPPSATAPLRFWVPVGLTDVTSTPTYATAVNQAATTWTIPRASLRIAPHDTDGSMVIERMKQRGLVGDSGVSYQMPPLATEFVDANGISAVSAWIQSLP